MLFYLQGNILNKTEGFICHQVNCIGIMGGGIARQIAHRYPSVLEQYKEHLSTKQSSSFGTFLRTPIRPNQFEIINLFGQYDVNYNERATHYGALAFSLCNFSTYLKQNEEKLSHLQVYIPKFLGCGIGKGDWSIVKESIEQFANTVKNDVVIVNLLKG